MNARAVAVPPALASLRGQAGTWWRGRTSRERQAIGLVLAVLVVYVAWSVLIQLALRQVAAAPAQLDALEAQLQQMQRVAAESRGLRGATPVALSQATLALKAATERLGDKGRLVMQGERATLTLTGASTEALRAWLTEARNAARARPVEAQLTRSGSGYSGTLSLNLGPGS